jgi:hypothetical protein
VSVDIAVLNDRVATEVSRLGDEVRAALVGRHFRIKGSINGVRNRVGVAKYVHVDTIGILLSLLVFRADGKPGYLPDLHSCRLKDLELIETMGDQKGD